MRAGPAGRQTQGRWWLGSWSSGMRAWEHWMKVRPEIGWCLVWVWTPGAQQEGREGVPQSWHREARQQG